MGKGLGGGGGRVMEAKWKWLLENKGVVPTQKHPPHPIKTFNNQFNNFEAVPRVEFMYTVFTRMPGESYLRRHRSSFVVELVLRISSAN